MQEYEWVQNTHGVDYFSMTNHEQTFEPMQCMNSRWNQISSNRNTYLKTSDTLLQTYPSGTGSNMGIFSTSHSTAGAAISPSPQKSGPNLFGFELASLVGDDGHTQNANAMPLMRQRNTHKKVVTK